MRAYFFANDSGTVGPLTIEELIHHGINNDTYIWRQGWADWHQAGNVPEIQNYKRGGSSSPHQGGDNSPVMQGYQNASVPQGYQTNHALQGYQGSAAHQMQNQAVVNGKQHRSPQAAAGRVSRYDYSQVEDIAGVDYKKAIWFTGGLLVLNILFTGITLTWVGMALTTALSIVSWMYFKAYFDAKKDELTGKWILATMGAYALFGLTYLFALPFFREARWLVDYMSALGNALAGAFSGNLLALFDVIYLMFLAPPVSPETFEFYGFIFQLIFYLIIIASIMSFIAGIRLLYVNRRYPFPLKRIGLSSMIMIPFLFLGYTFAFFTREPFGIFTAVLLNLPYIFLLHHFYRAEKEDATP